MKLNLCVLTTLLLFLQIQPSIHAQITMTGDYSPSYDGASDPWHVGGDTDSNGIGDSELQVGITNFGDMSISGGSHVTSQHGRLGVTAAGSGSAIVDGVGSTWTVDSDFRVAENGNGILTIQNGGQVTSNDGWGSIGTNSGSEGIASVSGAGSTLAGFSVLSVGEMGGFGELSVSNAGHVVNQAGTIGIGSNSIGNVFVDGLGSTWDNTAELFIGSSGFGTLDISNGGQVSSQNSFLGFWDGEASVTVDGANSIWTNSGLYVGGTFTETGGDGTINIQNGGSVETAGTAKLWDNGIVNLSGGLFQVGTLDLTAPGATGNFNFTGGMLDAETILGSIQQDGGTLAPGDSPGLTTIDGNYVMNSGFIEFEIGGLVRESEFDAIDITGIVQLDGTIDVNLIDGFSASLGDSFQLVDATGGILGTPLFDFTDASLASGLQWDTSNFQSSGSIFVSAVPEPASVGLLILAGLALVTRRRRRIA